MASHVGLFLPTVDRPAVAREDGATIAHPARDQMLPDGERLEMKTLLICHEGADLHREGMARWLASFSTLTGVVVLREGWRVTWRRARRELRRVGAIRFADGLAFRVYYKLFTAKGDKAWAASTLHQLCQRYPPLADDAALLQTDSPNSPVCEQFMRDCEPDVVLALCKTLLKPRIFTIPKHGTFVLHPGSCPEYRNAHGCFWALASDDLEKVAVTLLRIDAGVDTGPVYGQYGYGYDEVSESHVVIQHRVVLENLDVLQQKLNAIVAGVATPIDVSGRPSAAWGQPWLTSYIKWKYKARRRKTSESTRPALS